MAFFDHLCGPVSLMEGSVVSVTPAGNGGVNVIIRDDSGIDIGNRRRWLGYLTGEKAKTIRIGCQVKFLPGSPQAGKKMGRAYDIEVLIQREPNRSSRDQSEHKPAHD